MPLNVPRSRGPDTRPSRVKSYRAPDGGMASAPDITTSNGGAP